MSQYGSIGAGAFSGDMAREKQYQADEQARFNRRMQRQQFEEEQKRNKPKMVSVKEKDRSGFVHTKKVNRDDFEWQQENDWKNKWQRRREVQLWKQQDEDRKRAQERQDKEWEQQDEDRKRAQKQQDNEWEHQGHTWGQQYLIKKEEHERKKKEWEQQDEDRKRSQERQDKEWEQQDKVLTFNQMLAQDELDRKRELRKREDAKWEEMEAKNKAAKEQQNASFSSLIVNGIKNGKTADNGAWTMISPQYLEEFNKQNGTNFGGMTIVYKDQKTGEVLPFPQIVIYNKGEDGKTDFTKPIVMSKEQVKGMFASFPDVSQEMADAAGIDLSAGNTWKGLLTPDEAVSSTQSKQRVERIKYKIKSLEDERNGLMTAGFMPTDSDDPDGRKRKRIAEINREILSLNDEWDSLVGTSGSASGGGAGDADEGASASGGAQSQTSQSQAPKRKRWEAIGTNGTL